MTNSESFDQAANLTLLRSLVVTFSALEISLIIKYYKDKLLLHQLKTDTVRQNGKILSFNFFSINILLSLQKKSSFGHFAPLDDLPTWSEYKFHYEARGKIQA